MLSAGIQATNTGGKKGDNGIAFPFGGGATLYRAAIFALYGEGYAAPGHFTNSVKNFVDTEGSLRWLPITALMVKPAIATPVLTVKMDDLWPYAD